jgi:KDO2-lipid IV(A) lauroyltransferase
MFYFVYSLLWVITLLPLKVLYLLSDLLYPVIYYVVGYRKRVVRENLLNSFPEKSEKERLLIEKRFYHFFCDLFIEIAYEIHLSEKEISKRVTFGNLDLLREQYAKGKSVILMCAHYGNWEWSSTFPLVLPKEAKPYGIYKKLSNKDFDQLILKLRTRFGGITIEMKEFLRLMINLKKENKLGCFELISDQTPPYNNIHLWTNFLNQDTPVITGAEQLARKFDYPVFYVEILRKKRGYYHCEFVPITLDPLNTSEFEITEKFTGLLETSIKAHPEFWLWSHKRWKYKRKAEQ